MAQCRQSGGLDRIGASNGAATNQVSIGIRGSHKQGRTAPPHRRLKGRGVSIGALALILSLAFIVSVVVFFSSDEDLGGHHSQDDELGNDTDFLTNVTRTQRFKVLKFGHGSVVHSQDSRYWDRDNRRRDEDYSEDVMEHATNDARDGSDDTVHNSGTDTEKHKKASITESYKGSAHRGVGLYNEAGRDELKMYEAEYEASLRSAGKSKNEHVYTNQQSYNAQTRRRIDEVDPDDEYDDGIGLHEIHVDYYNDSRDQSDGVDGRGSSKFINVNKKDGNIAEDGQETSSDLHENSNPLHYDKINAKSVRKSTIEWLSVSKKKARRHKFSGSCEMKILNSTSQLIEPLEGQKFVRFSLQDTEIEEKPDGEEQWEYRFAGHQNLAQREKSFIAHDQKINCGFVGSPKGSSSTGFDLAEDDAKYIRSCHIAVVSCIFGNSDRLRDPMGKTVSRLSRKNVCFVMFVDETTLQTISSDGRSLDRMGFIGLWKVVMVKILPYTDMRRVGKIPKFLSHRLFPSARYSIWLDSKLRLQLDPMLILEYFLWRKGYEYAISKHYDRHCVWEEVAQNKKLNKYNHTVIDQQFEFYQADGLKRFDALDPNKLLPSNVPEGSVIIRAHTPMSNLFSCLWFNEVDRFTPRDQLSFAYTYHKLRRMNPAKPLYLNMFKDCERRKIAKLFRHRSEEKRIIPHMTE